MSDTSTETTRGDAYSEESRVRRRLRRIWRVLRQDRMGLIGIVLFMMLVVMAVFAPVLATHDPQERNFMAKYEEPSSEHLLGTDGAGRDLYSRLIYGARPAFFVGLASALAVAITGTTVGVLSGYYGGYVDDFLMRLVDFVYGIPFLPMIIILVGLWQPSLFTILLAISLLLWRNTARVIRSHVLTLKEKPYIKSAQIAGASDRRIIVKHILPNVLPLTFLYGSFAIGWAILTEANASYLGFGDPTMISWGQMLLDANTSQALIRDAWWWIAAPGGMIMITIISVFSIARGYEEVLNPELEEQ